MAKTLSAALRTHLESECQTRAFLWAIKANKRVVNISGITQADPAVITTTEEHNLTTGEYVAMDNIVGMTEFNDSATGTWQFHEVTVLSDTTFSVPVNSTGYTAYTSGGLVHLAYGFTSHTEDIVRDGMRFEAETAFIPTATSGNDTLSVPSIEMDGVMVPAVTINRISEADIAAGKLDYAEIRVQIVNYEDLSQGGIWMARGFIGTVTMRNDVYQIELRGLTQVAQQALLELYSQGCRYDLGSPRCGVNLASFTVSGTVSGVTDRATFTDSGQVGADDLYTHGLLTFTGGENAGISMEVRSWTLSTKEFVLWLPLPFDIANGDTYSVYQGCDKKLATCRDKFNNLINHGGFPHLPGEDALFKVTLPKKPEVDTN